MDETMRIIDSENPIKVWREKRGMTVRQLADNLGLHDIEIEKIESGISPDKKMQFKLSSVFDVLPDMLVLPKVAP
jgi:transcriptional regulator with XRE-family HTH domain